MSTENPDDTNGNIEDLEGWEVESSDGDDSDSDGSGGWIDVSSDGNGDLNLSDSSSSDESDDEKDDENENSSQRRTKKRRKTAQSTGTHESDGSSSSDDEVSDDDEVHSSEKPKDSDIAKPLSESLAAKKILTPADFARLNELKISAIEEAAKASGSKNPNSIHQKILKQLRKQQACQTTDFTDLLDPTQHRHVSEGDIIGKQKKAKQGYEERMNSIQAGREGREKFGSNKKSRGRKGLKNGAMGSSTNEVTQKRKKEKRPPVC